MKKIIFILTMLMNSIPASANSLTANLGLTLITSGTYNWGLPINNNASIIDSSVAVKAATQTFVGANLFTSTANIYHGASAFLSSATVTYGITAGSITATHYGPIVTTSSMTINIEGGNSEDFVINEAGGNQAGMKIISPYGAVELGNYSGYYGEAGYLYTSNMMPLIIGANHSSDIFISSINRVGIGTTWPTAKLDVYGGISALNDIVSSGSFRGNGSYLTGIAGDSFGSHVATKTIDMDGFSLTDLGAITSTNPFTLSGSSLTVTDKIQVTGTAYFDGQVYSSNHNVTGYLAASGLVSGASFKTTGAPSTHKVNIEGGILATSSVTAQAGFYGDGSTLTGILGKSPVFISSYTVSVATGIVNLNAGFDESLYSSLDINYYILLSTIAISGIVNSHMLYFNGDKSAASYRTASNFGGTSSLSGIVLQVQGVPNANSPAFTGVIGVRRPLGNPGIISRQCYKDCFFTATQPGTGLLGGGFGSWGCGSQTAIDFTVTSMSWESFNFDAILPGSWFGVYGIPK